MNVLNAIIRRSYFSFSLLHGLVFAQPQQQEPNPDKHYKFGQATFKLKSIRKRGDCRLRNKMPVEELSQTQIIEQLNLLFSDLIGHQLTLISGAADMRGFNFGPLSPKTSMTGKKGYDTPYSLHVQCPWSLSQNSNILTGYSDWRYTPDGSYPEEIPSMFESLQQRIFVDLLSDQDSKEKVITNRTDDFTIISASLQDALRVEIKLSPDYVLYLFPYGSKGEHWRFFTKERHYVAEDITMYIISGDD